MQFHTDLDSQRKQYTRVNFHILSALIEQDTIVMWAHEYDAMVIFESMTHSVSVFNPTSLECLSLAYILVFLV